MIDNLDPMNAQTLRRLMSDRSIRAFLEQRRNERRADSSRFGLAVAMVVANRTASNWAWLDQDRSTHRP
jgi:hypothetical protein